MCSLLWRQVSCDAPAIFLRLKCIGFATPASTRQDVLSRNGCVASLMADISPSSGSSTMPRRQREGHRRGDPAFAIGCCYRRCNCSLGLGGVEVCYFLYLAR